MKAIGTAEGIIAGFACPQCAAALPDYALSCKSCDADLRHTEIRRTLTLNNSINRKDQSIFFYVSPLKLVVMSVATFGFYELFWFYKNWTYADEHTNRTFMPMISSIFRFLTLMGLMNEMTKAGAEAGQTKKLHGTFFAVLYFLLTVIGRSSGLDSLCLIPAQRYVNSLNTDSPTPINDKFSVVNWVAIVLGGGFQIVLLARFIPHGNL